MNPHRRPCLGRLAQHLKRRLVHLIAYLQSEVACDLLEGKYKTTEIILRNVIIHNHGY